MIKKEFEVLFELAEADLKVVERLFNEEEIKEEILLFHLQQAVEKLLKVLLSSNKVEYPKIHDIERLIKLCNQNKIVLPEYVEEFVKLTPYAVEFRYGLLIDETLDIGYYYERALGFKKFVKELLNL
jgi:HEPN domain-containing protein